MLADWARRDGRPFAWYAIDEPDDDPVGLVAYLTAAINQAVGGLEYALEALAGGAPPVEIVALLTHALGAVEGGVVVVLDDAHLLEDAECARLLTTFADRIPAGARQPTSGRIRCRLSREV